MELQVSHRVRAEISQESIFRGEAIRDTGDTSDIMPVERRGIDRGRDMSRPYSHVGKHTAQNERCGIHGISERQEQSHDIPKVGEHEICVPQPRILVQGILR